VKEQEQCILFSPRVKKIGGGGAPRKRKIGRYHILEDVLKKARGKCEKIGKLKKMNTNDPQE
jgi:hypothetical protein